MIKVEHHFLINFWSILGPFWDHVGTLWGPFWVVLGSQRGDHHWRRGVLIPLHCCLGAFGGPRANFGPILALLGTQNGANIAPQGQFWPPWDPELTQNTSPRTILGWFLTTKSPRCWGTMKPRGQQAKKQSTTNKQRPTTNHQAHNQDANKSRGQRVNQWSTNLNSESWPGGMRAAIE